MQGKSALSLPSKDVMAAIAATRFGLGARPGEIAAAAADPRGFLLDQIRPAGADQPLGEAETSAARFAAMRDYQLMRRAARQSGEGKFGEGKAGEPKSHDLVKAAQILLRDKVGGDFLARARLGTNTQAAFRERWALFWANHFTVSATKQITAVLVGPFEQEAIRPHVFGRFEDLLVASSTHPAMLTYLDQAQSIGPGSRTAGAGGKAGRKRAGLNENLAREILELHTVGVDARYSQADVTEFARALTGFGVGGGQDDRAGQFVFRDNAHEPGARTVMGKRYAEDGLQQPLAVLKALAADPRTARHLSIKLARHFVADDPPPALVARLERAWLGGDGRLDKVAAALVAAPEAWDPTPAKFKTPYEFTISAWRVIGAQPSAIERLAPILTGLGQKPFSAPSPKGWAENAAEWCAPDALVKRMQWSQGFAAVVADQQDPSQTAQAALGARLTPAVATAVARAETRREAFALLLMSPEFQRR